MPPLVMQNAKDSFYMALRSRLAVVNPARTILLRGATRPGMLVADAEAASAQMPSDVFVLRWLGLAVDMDLASAMTGEDCEISYSTSGTQAFGGLDRGRMLSAMDAEILAIFQPFHTGKMNYAVQPACSMQTQIFWDEPSFTPVNVQRDRLSRSARVMVYSYQEQGEL